MDDILKIPPSKKRKLNNSEYLKVDNDKRLIVNKNLLEIERILRCKSEFEILNLPLQKLSLMF